MIITTDADEYTAHLHTRMPVMLARDLEEVWLDPEITSASEILELLTRSAGVTLDTYPVSRLVNKASVEGERLIQRVE
jgi:putative SOS response-associated peptidase YedK